MSELLSPRPSFLPPPDQPSRPRSLRRFIPGGAIELATRLCSAGTGQRLKMKQPPDARSDEGPRTPRIGPDACSSLAAAEGASDLSSEPRAQGDPHAPPHSVRASRSPF